MIRIDNRIVNIQNIINQKVKHKLSKRDNWLYVGDIIRLKNIVRLFACGQYVEASDNVIDLDTNIREEIPGVAVEWFNRIIYAVYM
jgi:hypothetical protein